MSRFFSDKFKTLIPYTPGEQPKEMKYIKLNTNESPFPPSVKAQEKAAAALSFLQLYPDPDCRELTRAVAERYGVKPEQVLMTNGSDEILNFAFMAYCDKEHPAAFADITYGFYSVFAEINCVPYVEIPLKDDFTVDAEDYIGINKTVFIANPNAPTGLSVSLSDIERIARSNPNNVVVIDEAYVDFGGESAVGLLEKCDNLLVTMTFSKSRSMAGARLGFGIGSPALIQDLNTIKYSTNPYNINRATMAAGIGVMADEEYTAQNCRTIMENREFTTSELEKLGFEVLKSDTNFVFARHSEKDGGELYAELKRRGILVRHFTKERIAQFVRITIGTKDEMQVLINTLKDILGQ